MSQAIEHDLTCTCRDASDAAGRAVGKIPSAARAFRAWLLRRRQMQALLEFDDRLLRDVGISREVAEREAAAQLYWRAYARRHQK